MQNNINPALQDLQELVGTWEMEISNASFFPDSTIIIKGTAPFDWFEGGDFLILRYGKKKNKIKVGPLEAIYQTPVVDIKPVFLIHHISKNYFISKS